MRTLPCRVRALSLALALLALSAAGAAAQLGVRFEPAPVGTLKTGSTLDNWNDVCDQQTLTPRIEFFWVGDKQSLSMAYGKPSRWGLVPFQVTIDGASVRCSDTPDGSCYLDISGSGTSTILETGAILLNREHLRIRKSEHPRAFTTGMHTVGFAVPSLHLSASATYGLDCGGGAPPPPPPVATPLPEYRIGWEPTAAGVGAKGVVADGRTRLGLVAVLPGVRQVVIETRFGRFEDRQGNSLGTTVQTTGGEAADTLWYRPPESPDGGWRDAGGAPAELGAPGLPGAWTAPRMLRDSIVLRFRNARGEDVVRRGGLWVLPTPIVMVHGFTGDTTTWSTLRPRLATEGYGSRADNYYAKVDGSDGVLAQASHLRSVIADELVRYRKAGFMAGRVDVLAHSMGGLIARAYVTSNRYRDDVRKVVMMGTPNHGIEGMGDRMVGDGATLIYGHGDLQNDAHPESAVLQTLNASEFDGTRSHLGSVREWGNIYALGTDRVVSDWSAPLNGAQFLELPTWERTAHSPAVVNASFTVGILESQTTFDQLRRWLGAPIPPGPLDRWEIRVAPEFDEDGTLVGDLDATAWTSWRHWARRPSETVLSRDRIRTERGRAKIRWFRNGQAFAEILMDQGTDIMLHGQSRRRVSVTLRAGRGVFQSKGVGDAKGAVNVVVEPFVGGRHRRWDLRTRGTVFAVELTGEGTPRVTVLEGEVDIVDVTDATEVVALAVRPGEEVTPDDVGPPQARRASGLGWWDAARAWAEAAPLPDVWTGAGPGAGPTLPPAQPPPSSGGGEVTLDNAYALDVYPADFNSLAGRITGRANQGFTPVGLAVYAGKVHVLYLGGGVMPISGWQMDVYEGSAELEQGITGRMREGYLPNGLAWSEGRFYVLYVMTDFTGSAWRVVTSDLDLQAVKRDIDPWIREDYVPFDVTLADGRYLTLLVQLQAEISKTWSLDGAYPADLDALIRRQLGAGYIPWGLLVDEVANVLFLGG